MTKHLPCSSGSAVALPDDEDEKLKWLHDMRPGTALSGCLQVRNTSACVTNPWERVVARATCFSEAVETSEIH